MSFFDLLKTRKPDPAPVAPLSDSQVNTELTKYASLIQLTLNEEWGINSNPQEIEGGGFLFENFLGSAGFFIGLRRNKMIAENTIFFTAPIVHLPQSNQIEFFKRCLEINETLIGCALSLDNGVVRVVGERVLTGLDKNEFKSMLQSVANSANDLDDKLAREFGAPLIGLGLKTNHDKMR